MVSDGSDQSWGFSSNRNRKPANSWKLNDSLFNEHCIKGEIKNEIKDFLVFNEKEGKTYQTMGYNKSHAKKKS